MKEGGISVSPSFTEPEEEMTEQLTDQQVQQKVAALLEERRGYEAKGDQAGVAGVDAELRRLGASGAPKAKRAVTR